MTELLTSGLAQLGIEPPDGAVDALVDFSRRLLEKNQVMNLTAITDPEDVAILHFLDCAALLKAASFQNARVIDVGTGAGFPGLVLKLLEPSISLVLLDSLGKRVHWLEEVCREMGLTGVTCLHARAEEQALQEGFRDGFDLVTSRAVAPMRLLTELCLPFARTGGRFLAMKSADCAQELAEAHQAVKLLGGRMMPSFDYTLPHRQIERRVAVVEKVAATPKGYPRRWAKIQKQPL